MLLSVRDRTLTQNNRIPGYGQTWKVQLFYRRFGRGDGIIHRRYVCYRTEEASGLILDWYWSVFR